MGEPVVSFRQLVTLNNGARALLRPLIREDNENLIDLFARHPDEELKFFHSDVRDRALVTCWTRDLDYARVLPLVAEVDGLLVGDTILRFQSGPERHIALVSIFISKEFRRLGLGTAMLRTLIDLARKSGVAQLQAEIPSSHVKPISAFKELGFQHQATFPDHFLAPDGESHDMDVLILALNRKHEEF